MARTRPPFATRPAFESLEQIAREIRREMVVWASHSNTPLPAPSFSCLDLLIALYWNCLSIDAKQPDSPNRDRFIWSRTHGILALYGVLARRGFFPQEELKQFNKEGCRLAARPTPTSVPGLEWTPGQAGQGLGLAIGTALAARLTQKNFRTVVLLDERDLSCESLATAASTASRLELTNLVAVIETVSQENSSAAGNKTTTAQQWKSRGWEVREVDGHDPTAIGKIFQQKRTNAGAPLALVASTVAGKGIRLAASDPWKNRAPTADEVEEVSKELQP